MVVRPEASQHAATPAPHLFLLHYNEGQHGWAEDVNIRLETAEL